MIRSKTKVHPVSVFIVLYTAYNSRSKALTEILPRRLFSAVILISVAAVVDWLISSGDDIVLCPGRIFRFVRLAQRTFGNMDIFQPSLHDDNEQVGEPVIR